MLSIKASIHSFGLIALLVLAGSQAACSSDDVDEYGTDGDVATSEDAGPPDVQRSDTPSSPNDIGTEEDATRPPQDSGGEWEWDDDEDFGIVAVSPAHGPVEGGTEVFVHGADLTDNTQLLFGATPVETQLSQGQLVAETPPADGPGPVTVRAISTGGEVSEIPNGFTYAVSVEVDHIVPDRIPTAGSVELTLEGSGFSEPMGVSFDGHAARRIEVVNSRTARVIAPPMPRGYADVRVSVTDDHTELEDGVYFFDRLDVHSVEPAVGSVAGGESVILRGSGFTPETTVQFGDQHAQVQSVDMGAGEMTLLTPASPTTGAVDIRIDNIHDTLRLEDGFYYDDQDTNRLYAIWPATAPTEGGTEHIVSGRDLDAADAEIRIGDQDAPILEAHPTHAVVEAPESAAGMADVTLHRSGTEVDRLTDGVEFLAPFSIDEISPTSGDADGGDEIAITGQGLDLVTDVFFGGLPAAFEYSSGQLSVTTPPSEPGSVDVTLSDGQREVIAEDGFYFEGPLDVWSMRPTRGAMAGNTLVTLQGRGFDGPIDITIADQEADDIRRLDPYTVSFRTPRSTSTGPEEVVLEAMGAQASPPQPFIYFNPMSSFGGAHGPRINGSVNVSVLAQDGTPIPGAFVMLSTRADTPYQGYTDDNGQITLSGPGVLGPQTITATAADLSTFTVRELDAENLTVILNPIEIPENGDGNVSPPPIAHFEGEISITGKGSDPEGGAEYNMSQVRVTRTSVGGHQLNPGADSIVDGEGGHYSLRSRVGDMVLVGLCGYYDETTEVFTPKMMAVQRNLSIGNGQVKQVDLECNIPLEEYLPVKITNPVYAPDGPTINEITTYIDFGFEGVFRMPNPVVSLDDILYGGPLPGPDDKLGDIEYAVVAGSYNGTGLPYTQTRITNIESPEQLQSTPPLVGVPELLDPDQGGTIDETLRFGLKGTNDPDFFYIVLRNSVGLPVWTFMVPGGDDMIPLPEFPSFSALPAEARPEPYQPGSLYTVAYAPRIEGFDYNAFTYGDFSTGRWSAFGVDSWILQLRD